MEVPEDREGTIARYAEGPALLERAIADVPEEVLDAPPARGGWTIRQIVHHVVDGDDLWKIGIKTALGNAEAEFTLAWYWAVPQVTWAERWAYAQRPLDVSLALFRAGRSHVLELLEHVPGAWGRSVGIRKPDGDLECVPVGFVVRMQADHVLHHIKRIEAIRQEMGCAVNRSDQVRVQ